MRRFCSFSADREDAQHLVGSWAGAIGHLQVNPSNVIAHGTDGNGDGVVDLHVSLADALATSAKFLLDLGYAPGVDWGLEVNVPDGFDWLLATRETLRPISFFAERGVTRVQGKRFCRHCRFQSSSMRRPVRTGPSS